MANRTLLLTGPYAALNHVAGAETVTPTSQATGYEADNARDGEPGSKFKFNSAADPLTYLVDKNRLANGNLETFTDPSVPDDWIDISNGTGALSKETSLVNEGTGALKLTGGGAGNGALARQNQTFLSWDRITVSVAIRGDGTNSTFAFVKNKKTGHFLQANGSWSATPAAFAGRSAASYATTTVAGVDLQTTEPGIVPLIFYVQTTTGVGYIDSFYCWPHSDFSAFFGHDLEAQLTVKIRIDDNDSPTFANPTDVITHSSRRRPSFYAVSASVISKRYVQLHITGADLDAPGFGEWVLGRYVALPRQIMAPYRLTPDVGLIGDSPATSLRAEESMHQSFEFLAIDSELDALKQQIMAAGRFGGNRTILVPDENDPEVYFGSMVYGSINDERGYGRVRSISATFTEMDYGVDL
jgi:hypothetical protein